MKTPTSRAHVARRWARILGTGATAVVAARAMATSAGAATPATPDRCHRKRGRDQRIEHGGPERQQRPDHRELDDDHAVLQDGYRVGECDRGWRLRDGDGDGVEEVEDDDRGPQHHGHHAELERLVHAAVGTTAQRHRRRPGGGFLRTGGGGFRGDGGGASGTRPSFPAGGAGSSNFRKVFALDLHRLGQGDGGQRVDRHGVRHHADTGSLPARATKSSSKSTRRSPPHPRPRRSRSPPRAPRPRPRPRRAASTDLAVGDCVSAFGPAATNGSVTATTVRITSTGGGTCTGRVLGGGAAAAASSAAASGGRRCLTRPARAGAGPATGAPS